MAHYISATVYAYVSQDPEYQVSQFGKEYCKFVLGIRNPSKSEKPTFTWIECTIWDESLIVKAKTNLFKRGDEIIVLGQFYQDTYHGKTYNKLYVRDFVKTNSKYIDANKTPDIMDEQGKVTTNSESNIGNANVDLGDFDKNF